MEMSHMHLVKVFLKFNSWWFLHQFGWFSNFKHESVFSLMFPKEVRWFHECYNFLRQTNGKQCYTFIYSCLPWSLDWSLWWHQKKSKQKIMTKIKKKNSLGNLATHEKVLFVLPPNTFLTKKWIQFHSLCLFWCHRNCACYSIMFT